MAQAKSPTRPLLLAATGGLLLPRAACAQPSKRRRIAYLAQALGLTIPPLILAGADEVVE